MMMVLVMLTRVTKPLMSLLLMARMMHGEQRRAEIRPAAAATAAARVHMVH